MQFYWSRTTTETEESSRPSSSYLTEPQLIRGDAQLQTYFDEHLRSLADGSSNTALIRIAYKVGWIATDNVHTTRMTTMFREQPALCVTIWDDQHNLIRKYHIDENFHCKFLFSQKC